MTIDRATGSEPTGSRAQVAASECAGSRREPLSMRRAVLAAIRLYQRYLSPHKGFGCAYRELTGRPSCSVLGYRAVRRHGIWAGLGLVRRRTFLCGVAFRRHGCRRPGQLHAQRGVCDAGCDLPCHGGCEPPGAGACDNPLACCDCGSCDWPRRKQRTGDGEKSIYIPPKAGRGGAAQRRPDLRA